MKRKHPLKEFRIQNGYTDVQKLALDLAGTQSRGKKFMQFSTLLYKIEEEKEVSKKKIEFLIESLKITFSSQPAEYFDLLKDEILFWKYFPEYRQYQISQNDLYDLVKSYGNGYYKSIPLFIYSINRVRKEKSGL